MRRLASGALCVLILTTSCGGSNKEAAPSSTSSPTTSTTVAEAPTTTLTTTTTQAPTTTTADPGPSDEDQILDVVTRFWDVVVEANNPPDPDSPLWATVASGDQLDDLRERSREKAAAGEANRYPEPEQSQLPRLEILVIEDGFAVVNVCLRDDTVLYSIETNEVLNDEVLYLWIQLTLQDDGGWRVIESTLIEQLDGSTSCAEAF
jgi:hypothetical protein